MPRSERLQKILARSGLGSRRACESLILDGRVTVNGAVVRELGTRADPAADRIEVDGEAVFPEEKVYLILHKPPGYITTARDPQGRPTVMDLVSGVPARVFPVGRLDYDAEGLLFMTNDGELAHFMAHPRWGVEKTYLAHVRGMPDTRDLSRLQAGVPLKDGVSAPARARIAGKHRGGAIIEITVHEGRKHQVKDMCSAIGHPVERLIRTSFGPLHLGSLGAGRHRYLTNAEIRALAALFHSPRKPRGRPTHGGPPRPADGPAPGDKLAPFELAAAALALMFGFLLVAGQLLLTVDSWRSRLAPFERLEGAGLLQVGFKR